MLKPLRRLYDWTMEKAADPRAVWWLAAVSFAESSFFPIPPDVMLIPMVIARPDRAFHYAAVCLAASVLGGLAGYGIGFFLYDLVGQPLVEFYAAQDAVAAVAEQYHEYGWWIVFGGGLTPVPYKIITIVSGALALDPLAFTGASIVGRGLRFFAVAALLWKFGPPIRRVIEERFGLMTALFFILLVGGFAVLKLAL
ncbi:DedA family protein [Marivibrio halodurans]|uniref:DedA family protein n=1 Tax=Marivibrio halodurans TaxID=2039722 RepID=A0A8J7SKZ3_9PROT|nr:YqaA family protein [Marivibrio halodurans]MBP5858788.1 DedA family protein [Marivibrio halodurans]